MTTAIGTNWATRRSDGRLPRAGATTGRTFGRSFGRNLVAGLKAVQYAQTIAVMSRLPDDILDKAGLRRADIPEYARCAVYGDEAPGAR